MQRHDQAMPGRERRRGCGYTFCCKEVTDCTGRCAGPGGEFAGLRGCFENGFNGTDRSVCADVCNGPSAFLAPSTQALFACLTKTAPDAGGTQLCSGYCFGGEPQ
jgi:hypothetical protein